MKKIYLAVFAVVLISAGVGTSIILTLSPSFSDENHLPDPIDNDKENETAVFFPKFHVFNVEYYRFTVEGHSTSSPSYVTFLIQNMGNGSATGISVSFDFSTSLTLKIGKFLLQKLEVGEVREGKLELLPLRCSSQEIVNHLSVVIQCKENVTEILSPSFTVS